MVYTPASQAGVSSAPQAPGGTDTSLTGDPYSVNRNLAIYEHRAVPGLSQNPNDVRELNGREMAGPGITNDQDYGTALSSLLQMAQTDTSSVQSLQEQLIRAGYLDPRSRTFGIGGVTPGDATFTAYSKLLQDAISTGGDANVILGTAASNPKNMKGQAYWSEYQKALAQQAGASEIKRTTFSFTSPDGARALANRALQNHLGRGPTPEEVSAFYAALHGSEAANPTHETIRNADGTDVATSTTTDAAAQADAFATSAPGRANEAASYAMLGYMDALRKAIVGGG